MGYKLVMEISRGNSTIPFSRLTVHANKVQHLFKVLEDYRKGRTPYWTESKTGLSVLHLDDCPECRGTGEVDAWLLFDARCPKCNGLGLIKT